MTVTIKTLDKMKADKTPIVATTCYDASLAFWMEKASIDVVLVGDTLGEVVQGHTSTIPVTLENMCYHTACVSRKYTNGVLIADIPFLQQATIDKAINSAQKLMQSGATMVKMEGGAFLAPIVQKLSDLGVPVCAHIGYTPQSLHSFGVATLVGKQQSSADKLIQDAHSLVAAGARLLIVECVPDSVGANLAKILPVPVIGIGAGPDCDGQILVSYDMLGITNGKIPPFSKCFLDSTNPSILKALQAYSSAVKSKVFPSARAYVKS